MYVDYKSGTFINNNLAHDSLGANYRYMQHPSQVEFAPSLRLLKTWEQSGRHITYSLSALEARTKLVLDNVTSNRAQYDESEMINLPHLLPHQRSGVRFLIERRRVILADDLGRGKTCTALTAAAQTGESILFLTKRSLIEQVADEVRKWIPSYTIRTLYRGAERTQQWLSQPSTILISNWEALITLPPAALRQQWGTFIGDEAHMIKNRKAKVSKRTELVASRSQRVYLLTATPLEKQPSDLWQLLHILDPDKFSSYWRWYNCFTKTFTTKSGIRLIKGTQNEEILQDILFNYQLRRLGKRIEPQFITVPIRLHQEQLAIYQAITDNSYIGRYDLTIPNEAVRQIYQRQASVDASVFHGTEIPSAKLEAVIDLLDTFPSDQKVVIFSSYRQPIIRLSAVLGSRGHLYLAGSHDAVSPEELLNRKLKLLTTYASLGAGANLQAASICILLDLPLSQTLFRQALGRINRIGQQSQPIYYILHALNTVDGDVKTLIENKMYTFDHVVDGNRTI